MNEPQTKRPVLSLTRSTAARPEKSALRLGFIPLTDCAPLVVAAEQGFFSRQGLEVTLVREPSWANIRDKVMLGALDGAQMLAGLPVASQLGITAVRRPLVAALSLGLGGNAITVSRRLYARMAELDPECTARRPATARALRKVLDEDRAAGRPPLTFAVVYPVSSHNYELRYWLGAAGVDPDRDVRIVVVPPPQMVARLRAGEIDGFCVGEPWNSVAVRGGHGHVLITSQQLWNHKPEKVLGVTQDWAERHPHTHRALVKALMLAGRWLDDPAHRAEAAALLARPEYVGVKESLLRLPLTDHWVYDPGGPTLSQPDFNVFHRYAAMFPWRSHALWFVTQMYRWGQVERPQNLIAAADRAYRPAIYRQVAAELGWSYPLIDHKPEGLNARGWTLAQAAPAPLPMGADRFFDASRFDPAGPVAYLQSFAVANLRAPLEVLEKMNRLPPPGAVDEGSSSVGPGVEL
ncbi:MAG TPA: CmpA/NrtA family ABC transporter substrate-binding protein [Gammaproteobacteria bacterium]|nr:CmpA/NrtA family ABC transporter substrate-binding protein [Gammaproteobacteria bacterium]